LSSELGAQVMSGMGQTRKWRLVSTMSAFPGERTPLCTEVMSAWGHKRKSLDASEVWSSTLPRRPITIDGGNAALLGHSGSPTDLNGSTSASRSS
jgi:hypothetical protein